jgi:hypothetical protein
VLVLVVMLVMVVVMLAMCIYTYLCLDGDLCGQIGIQILFIELSLIVFIANHLSSPLLSSIALVKVVGLHNYIQEELHPLFSPLHLLSSPPLSHSFR